MSEGWSHSHRAACKIELDDGFTGKSSPSASCAKDYLRNLGISAERLSTISYGEELPVCREHIDECRERNRHDCFVVSTARLVSCLRGSLHDLIVIPGKLAIASATRNRPPLCLPLSKLSKGGDTVGGSGFCGNDGFGLVTL
jgi:hypothetical protein